MKECYFCHNEIPEDALICPMCGSDLSNIDENDPSQSKEESVSDNQEPFLREKSQTRKKETSFKLTNMLQTVIHYLSFNLKRCLQPIQDKPDFETNRVYGYINIILASVLSSTILARIISAGEKSYQLLSQISILPNLTFRFNLFEWIWKLSIFFALYFLFLPIILYIFKKVTKKQSLVFHGGVTQFVGMNSFTYLLLWIAFVINLVAPLGMALPTILIIFIHGLSYQVSFVSATHLYFNQEGNSMNKPFQWSLLGMGIHSVLLFTIGYILIKL